MKLLGLLSNKIPVLFFPTF